MFSIASQFTPFQSQAKALGFEALSDNIFQALEHRFSQYTHGHLENWLTLIQQLPNLPNDGLKLFSSVQVGHAKNLTPAAGAKLKQQLMQLSPWRKGPYFIHGIHIDTEWRSDWKWQRLSPHLSPLQGKYVLDIGCGSGYHCWRMVGAGAKFVLGIDPSQLAWMQFLCIKHFLGQHPVHFLPLRLEDFPTQDTQFDTVFSMGILYHRKSPFEHLMKLKSLLKENGELVLETLVIDGNENSVLLPQDRYACMPNVWFLPSAKALVVWLKRAGFKNIHIVDINQTTIEEQRTTSWMPYQSLINFLDPSDVNKTIEGYPSPKRAILIANA